MAIATPVNDFLSSSTIAVVGVSRSGRKFGNVILRELRERGYGVVPVNPAANRIAGEPCYPDLRSIPIPVDGVVTVVPPARTAAVVRDAAAAGIPRVWMQQGSASDEAARICAELGLVFVRNECILMYARPVKGIHGFHRWLWRVLGKLRTETPRHAPAEG